MIDDCNAEPKRRTLMLTMTEYCNLQCVYCYEHKADKRVLSLETAQAAITEAFQVPGFDELEIDFFGGEPFAAFKRITEICEWVWSRPWPKPYICFTTTNGTLVHGKIQEWLVKNREMFVVGLSLDGTPEMHDANRSHSYGDIDIGFFKKHWPFQPVKMTISPHTISHMTEGIIYIHNLGFKLTANTAEGVEWTSAHYEIFADQMQKLADFYIDNPGIEPCRLLDMRLDLMTPSKGLGERVIGNYCGTGQGMEAVDVEGKKYPCQTFMPMSAGKEVDIDGIVRLLKSERNQDDPKCKDCPILSMCQTCYGLNYVHNGSPFIRSMDDCMFQKIRARGTAYLWAGMLTHRDRNYAYLSGKDDTDRFNMIEAVEKIDEMVTL